jgi:hypothetical protein
MAQVHMRIADRRSRRFVPLLAALGVALMSLATVLAAGASLAADSDPPPSTPGQPLPVYVDQEVRWFHSTPGGVSSFRIFVSPVEGVVAKTREIEVEKPSCTIGADGPEYCWLGPITVGKYIAVSAVGKNGIQSALSGWLQAPSPGS